MIKGYVNGVEKDITRVAMLVNDVDKGWEVRAQDGTILWGADKILTGISTISFKGYGLPLKSYTIKGNMVQNGTPTSDAPIMPQECGDPTANLFNPVPNADCIYNPSVGREIDSYAGSLPCSYNANTNTIAFEPAASWTHTAFLVECEVGKSYTLSCDNYGDGIRMSIIAADANKTVTRVVKNLLRERSVLENVTLQAGEKYICIVVSDATTDGCSISRPILAITSEFTDYIPYGYEIPITCGGETKTIYLREPLRKIGDYADSISSDSTDSTVTRNIVKIDLAKLTWSCFTGSNYAIFWALADKPLLERYEGYSNALEVTTVNAFASMPDNSLCIYEGSNRQQKLAIRYDAAEGSVSSLKDMLTQNSAMAWLVMEEPETEQYNAPILTPVKGSNTLSVDTSLAPSSVNITGHIKPIS